MPTHERIRRGLRRTYQISQLFGGLNVIDSVFLACRGVSRHRFSLLRPRRDDVDHGAGDAHHARGPSRRHRRHAGGELSHGQQRQLEIALALAGAPRFILFDEPAAGLSPTERRDLVAHPELAARSISATSSSSTISTWRCACREYVTMMHNGRVFKEGTPEEIENDPEVQEIYLGGGHG